MKKIKKIIYVDKLTPAPLDNKNVMLDWWEENMFDDGSYAFSGNMYLGFIAGVPVMATIKKNFVELKCIPQPCMSIERFDNFGNAVVRNMTGDECDLLSSVIPVHKQYIDDEREEDMKLLITFSIYEEEAIISFHWNVQKD